jgi:hypothetical protein
MQNLRSYFGEMGENIERKSCEGGEEMTILEQGDKSILLDYGPRICPHGIVVTYLGSLARGGAFSGPSLKVDDF